MKTTRDKYELPVAVSESPTELAKMLGTTTGVVSSSISHKRRGWAVVEVDPEDVDE